MKKWQKVAEAVEQIQSGNSVFVHGAAATPNLLLRELEAQAPRLRNVTLTHLHTEGPAHYADSSFRESFRVRNLFVGANLRSRVNFAEVDYLPCFLSEMPGLFRNGEIKVDVALLQVSPPDSHGYVSLGTSVDVAKSAATSAKLILAQVNARMPRTFGDALLPANRIDGWIDCDEALASPAPKALSVAEKAIGRFVAELVEDGSCLQLGIGNIPDAVLASLGSHKNLGLHTEMWSDGVLALLRSGAINNSNKKWHRGKSVCSFMMGSPELYSFAHDNPAVAVLEADYVNNPTIIARNEKMVAINSAVEVDLTGQVCADSVGARIISGVGGQVDFLRGAALSRGGKPIVAITSRTAKGKSRLVPALQAGAGVTTTRAHVHFVVSEYGIAKLVGRTLGERAQALIAIAHPEDRESLERSWWDFVRAK